MTAFTRLGSGIWDWEPWTRLGASARVLWLAIYTAAEGRRCVPGLWHGGLPTMADAARMQPDEARDALDQLLEHDLVEYDPKTRVLRLCALPDAGEYPNNGNVIKSWWTRFKTVPACAVRDAHVRMLRWIMDEGGIRSGKGISPNHEAAWSLTFGMIAIPAPRRRGVRRLADSDTSTQAQPSLFAPPPAPPPVPELPPGPDLTVPLPIVYASEAGSPQVRSQAVDNSAALHQQNKIRAPETVTGTVSVTNGIPDPGSRIPEFFSSSGSGGGGGATPDPNAYARPALTLVPPYTIREVRHVLTAHGAYDPRFDEGLQDALQGVIHRCVAARLGLADFDALGKLLAISGTRLHARAIVQEPDRLLSEVATAETKLRDRDARIALMEEFKAAGTLPK